MRQPMKTLMALSVVVVTIPVSACGSSASSSPTSPSQTTPPPEGGSSGTLRFTNVSESAGFTSLDTFGGHGIQVADVNGDGWLDVYVTHIFDPLQDRPDLLFINQGQDPPSFSERGVELGVADDGFFEELSEESHAAVFADFDNDGDFDLFNAHTWNGHNRLYRNDGAGRFVDISESARIEVRDLGTRGVAAADVNGDRRLDIIVSAWQGAQPNIYWNLGGLVFERRRLQGSDNRAFANQGITAVDYDGDGKPDVGLTAFEYVQEEGVGPIALMVNESPRLIDQTDFAGLVYEKTTSDYRGTNGLSFADIDTDGDLDLLITGFHGSKLYRNNGEGRFSFDRSIEGARYTGAFGDVDNDGDLDLYLAGETGIHLNDGQGGFSFKGEIGLTGIGNDARSAVFADMNNDGALDLLIASKQGPNTFFVNEARMGAWLKVLVRAPSGEAGSHGAKVAIYEGGHLGDVDFLRGFRAVHGATGYCSQDPAVQHFGVESGKAYDVRVEFPGGSVVTRTGVQPGQVLFIDAK
jgi:hypothetical protein